ncbi:MAG TPA: hypothetical protein VFZ59_26330, partial [Verrucomicrobiae bacterium]|nr:hypothetical protein [Verrucomicrobiae bacterium]
APRPDLRAVIPLGGTANVDLNSDKPFVVLVSKVVAEEIDDGKPVEETESSQHEFDMIDDAISFARAQRDPDKNPVETTVFGFDDEKWKLIERLVTAV